MDEVQTTVVVLAVALCGCGLLWAYDQHRSNVREVERCESSGGVALIAARGYVCVKSPPPSEQEVNRK